MYFEDRIDAARQLAEAIRPHVGPKPLILAIPRGAVPMGRVIADALGGELDVVLVRKLGSPFSDEYAVGSVAESGWTYVSDDAPGAGADTVYLERERARQLATIALRRAAYTPGRSAIEARARECVVIDDGLATGATMIAALHSVRAARPAKLVCAVPVASRESVARVAPLADAFVCLSTPPGFAAVGQFYRRFDQVDDREVVQLLARAAQAAT